MILNGRSKAGSSQGINPKQILALIDSLDKCIEAQLPLSRHPRTPWFQASEKILRVPLFVDWILIFASVWSGTRHSDRFPMITSRVAHIFRSSEETPLYCIFCRSIDLQVGYASFATRVQTWTMIKFHIARDKKQKKKQESRMTKDKILIRLERGLNQRSEVDSKNKKKRETAS